MDKDVVRLLIATEEHLSLLSQQIHEIKLIALATKDTLANLQPQAAEIYLMASTRCGISAKQIERESGVTYKTAWRMFKQIRSMLDEEIDPIGGPESKGVEMDESYFGAKRKRGNKRGRPSAADGSKQCVVGMVERKGKVIALT